MTAATGRVGGVKPISDHNAIPWGRLAKLGANVSPYRNWLMGRNSSGYAVPMATNTPGLISLGFAEYDQIGSSVAGDAAIVVRQQFVSGFVNSSAAGDTITDTDYAVPFWCEDNQTVGKLSNQGGSNRSLGGLVFGLDPDPDGGNAPMLWTSPIAWLVARGSLIANAYNGGSYAFADAAANTVTAETAMHREKVHGTATAIEFVGAAVAADNADYVTITVRKRDGSGGAGIVLGTYDSRAANQGAITAFVPAAFSLSGVAGALDLLETDVLTIEAAKNGAGKTLTGTVRVVQKVQ